MGNSYVKKVSCSKDLEVQNSKFMKCVSGFVFIFTSFLKKNIFIVFLSSLDDQSLLTGTMP